MSAMFGRSTVPSVQLPGEYDGVDRWTSRQFGVLNGWHDYTPTNICCKIGKQMLVAGTNICYVSDVWSLHGSQRAISWFTRWCG